MVPDAIVKHRLLAAFALLLVLMALPLPGPLQLAAALRPVSVALWLLFAVLRWSLDRRVLVVSAATIAFVAAPPVDWGGYGPGTVLALAIACVGIPAHAAALGRVVAASTAPLLFEIMRWSVPALQAVLDAGVGGAHAALAGLDGDLPRIGASYLDLSLLLLLATVLGGTARSRPRGLFLAAVLLLGACVANLASVAMLSVSREYPPAVEVAGVVRLASFPLLSWTVLRPVRPTRRPRRTRVLGRLAAITAPALLLAAVPAFDLVSRNDHPIRLLLLDRGLSNASIVDYSQFGDFSIGMFGELPAYAAADDVQVERAFAEGPFTAADLEPYDAVMMINNGAAWRDGEVEALLSFIDAGGGLLALCDHTDVAGQMPVTHRVIERAGMKLRFDSAYPLGRPSWIGSVRGVAHPTTVGLAEQDFAHGVGCSIELSGRARPILLGRYALSDNGIRENAMGAFLGNYRYEPGEPRGDLVLGAAAPYGRGRIVVLGDTSAFQNADMPQYWGFAHRLIQYTAGNLDFRWPIGAVLVVLACLAWMVAGTAGSRIVRAPAVVAMCVSLLWAEGRLQEAPSTERARPHSRQGGRHSVLMDTTGGYHAPGHLDYFRVRGEGEFFTALFRNGCRVYRGEFERSVVTPHLVILNNPARPLPARTQDALVAHVKSGGAVLVMTSFARARYVDRILEAAGIALQNVTPGSVREQRVRAYGEYQRAPSLREPWGLRGGPGVRTIATVGDTAFAALAPVGGGVICVVADPRIFESGNMDITRGGSPTTHVFLVRVLKACGVDVQPRVEAGS